MDVLRILSRFRFRIIFLASLTVVLIIAAAVLFRTEGHSQAPANHAVIGSSGTHSNPRFRNAMLADYSTTTGSSIPSNERVTSTVTVRQGTISVSPADPSSGPQVSQQAAVQAWLKTGVLPGTADTTQPSSVLYGNLTDTDYSTIQPDGSAKADYSQYPVWIIEYANAVVPLEGGYDPSTNPSSRPTSSTGPLYVFIDAASGSYLF